MWREEHGKGRKKGSCQGKDIAGKRRRKINKEKKDGKVATEAKRKEMRVNKIDPADEYRKKRVVIHKE